MARDCIMGSRRTIMTTTGQQVNGMGVQLIRVTREPGGQHRAFVVGVPELHATAPSREEALKQVQGRLEEWLVSGELVAVAVPAVNPVMQWFGRASPQNPDEQAYL